MCIVDSVETGLNINELSTCDFNDYKIQMVVREKPRDNNNKRTLREVEAIKVLNWVNPRHCSPLRAAATRVQLALVTKSPSWAEVI